MQNLLAQAPEKAIGGLLAAAGVFDMVPKRRAGLAMQVSQVLSVTQVLMIALDVLLGGPSNIGAVLRVRLNRALAGRRDLLTRCRASWSIDHFLKRSGACEVSARAEATILSHETAAIEAARAGNWRMVHFALGRPTARERGWSVAWLSNRSGLPESSIEAGISELARRRATG
ncbi:MAG: hypothetical protein IT456_23820 [Planctomycetes bacterium]|nr:hypothetical protein [Planctomycetota bacterium]